MRTASSTCDVPTMRVPLVTTSDKHLTGIFEGGLKAVIVAVKIFSPLLGQLSTLTASIRRGYEEED